MTSSYQRYFITSLKLIGLATIVILISHYYRTNIIRSESFSWSALNLEKVVGFCGLLLVIQLLYALIWMLFIRGFGHPINLSNAFISTYYPVLTKYLPGKGWFQIGRIFLMTKSNIRAEVGLTINIMEQIVVIYTGLLVSSPLLGRFFDPVGLAIILLIATILMLALLFYQDFFTSQFTRFRRFFKISDAVATSEKIQPGTAFSYILIYTVNWVLWGILFWIGVILLDSESVMSLPMAVGSFTFSSIVGFLLPVTPAGLGIREGALLLFLGKLVNPAALFNATIGIRFCTIIGEIIMFLIALMLKTKNKNA